MLTSAPFGLRPAYHPNGVDKPRAYPIASAYGTAIYHNSPVILNTNGTITIGTAAADILGSFQGVEYTDSTGKPTVSNYWPASTVATNITAWVLDDPQMVYDIQANGSLALTSVGDQADFVNPGNGSTATGLSSAGISTTLAGAGAQAQLRIVGLNLDPGNAWGDAYTVVQVQIARHQFIANKVAI